MLQEVREHLASLNPDFAKCIVNTNSTASLEKLSELLEEELTDDLVQFYSEFAGNEGMPLMNFVYGVCFHSAQTCLSEAVSQSETDMDLCTPTYPLEFATPEIDSRYTFDRSRVEIGSDRGTFLLCADYAPTKHGTFGQIIMLDYDTSKAFVVARSFSELIDQFSKDLEAGRYSFSTPIDPNEYWLDPDPEIDLGNWYISPSRWSHVPN